jgi:hypothetical protein
MEDEHCSKAGWDYAFTSSNYGVQTTPKKEYEIAIGKQACPLNDMLDKKGARVREVRPIEELKGLPLVKKSKLTEAEIVAVVWPLPVPQCIRKSSAPLKSPSR